MGGKLPRDQFFWKALRYHQSSQVGPFVEFGILWILLESICAWPDGVAFGPELAYIGAAWQPRRGGHLRVWLPPHWRDDRTEPCRDKLSSTPEPAMGSSMVSATVKTSHKVLPPPLNPHTPQNVRITFCQLIELRRQSKARQSEAPPLRRWRTLCMSSALRCSFCPPASSPLPRDDCCRPGGAALP